MTEAAKIPGIDGSEPSCNDKQPRMETFLTLVNTGNYS